MRASADTTASDRPTDARDGAARTQPAPATDEQEQGKPVVRALAALGVGLLVARVIGRR